MIEKTKYIIQRSSTIIKFVLMLHITFIGVHRFQFPVEPGGRLVP